MFVVVKKLINILLGFFGYGGGMTGFVWKMLPTNSIIQWIISVLSLFFPMLGPLLNIGSKMIL